MASPSQPAATVAEGVTLGDGGTRAVPKATARPRGFLAWYRRHYLLLNLPLLLILTDVVMVRFDVANHLPFNDANDLTAAFRRLDASPPGGAPTVLLIGNSAIREGVDQAIVEKALQHAEDPFRVYNFGISAARLVDQYSVLDMIEKRGVKPKAIVLGVNPFLIDDEVNPDSVYPWLTRMSPYIYFHRSRFRTFVSRGWRYLTSSKSERKELSERWDVRPQFKYNKPPTDKEFAGFQQKLAEEFKGRPADSFPLVPELPHMISKLHEQGIAVYVVLLPVNPAGTSKVKEVPPLIDAMRAALPPENTLDLAQAFGPELFYDMGHVNASGRERLTREVSTWLAQKKEFHKP